MFDKLNVLCCSSNQDFAILKLMGSLPKRFTIFFDHKQPVWFGEESPTQQLRLEQRLPANNELNIRYLEWIMKYLNLKWMRLALHQNDITEYPFSHHGVSRPSAAIKPKGGFNASCISSSSHWIIICH